MVTSVFASPISHVDASLIVPDASQTQKIPSRSSAVSQDPESHVRGLQDATTKKYDIVKSFMRFDAVYNIGKTEMNTHLSH